MDERIGFIGLGHMGQAIASNLVTANYALYVYNRTPHKAAGLVAQGAIVQTGAPAPAQEIQ
jgi:3-hydroxyisobutyrate dehydrogenase-like beta-hydroxyacid dehydrogenase